MICVCVCVCPKGAATTFVHGGRGVMRTARATQTHIKEQGATRWVGVVGVGRADMVEPVTKSTRYCNQEVHRTRTAARQTSEPPEGSACTRKYKLEHRPANPSATATAITTAINVGLPGGRESGSGWRTHQQSNARPLAIPFWLPGLTRCLDVHHLGH